MAQTMFWVELHLSAKLYVEILILNTSKYDLIWKRGYYRYNLLSYDEVLRVDSN